MPEEIRVESTEEAPAEAQDVPRETPEVGAEDEDVEAPDEVVEDHDGDEAGEEGEQRAEEPGKEKTPKGVQKKLDKLTARWKGEEARRKEVEAKARELEQQLSKQQAKPEGEPQLADYDYDPQAFLTARTKWEVKQTLEAERNQRAKAEQDKAAQQRHEQFQQRIDTFEEDHPDFKEVAFNPSVPITPAMGEAIAESDNGPAIAYYLGQHPDKAKEISALSNYSAIREIARLELSLNPASPPRKLTTAPPPIKPLDVRAPIKRKLEDLSVGELIERNKRRRAKGLR